MNAMLKAYNKDCINYGMVKKHRVKQQVVGITRVKILGNLEYDQISINVVDGFCSKLRARVGCFVRRTRNFAKRRKQIINLLYIAQINHNFIEAEKGLTPGMKESLTDKIWSWNDIFNVRLSFKI
jgi:hypothetical protein